MANSWDDWKTHGIRNNTPDKILLGAGTIHVGLTYDKTSKKWNFNDSIFGATNGGSKVSIKPEITHIDIDGALVKSKGLTQKQGETAEMEINFAEISGEIMKKSIFAKEDTSDAEGFTKLVSKANIETGDYFENFAFVGRTTTGEPIIIIFDNALCTSGLEVEGKPKEQSTNTITVECYGDYEKDPDLKTLPYRIYYPKVTTSGTTSGTNKA